MFNKVFQVSTLISKNENAKRVYPGVATSLACSSAKCTARTRSVGGLFDGDHGERKRRNVDCYGMLDGLPYFTAIKYNTEKNARCMARNTWRRRSRPYKYTVDPSKLPVVHSASLAPEVMQPLQGRCDDGPNEY